MKKIKLVMYIVCILVTCFMISCSKDEDQMIGEEGYFLSFNNVPIDTLQVIGNDYSPYSINTTCADLHVWVSSSTETGSNGQSQSISSEGVTEIEQQISYLLDPKGDKYNGGMPLPVKYTTVGCKSISIVLYDGNNNPVSDITEKARFHYVCGPNISEEDGCNIYVSADGSTVGKIAIGATIADYLALTPMVFAEAHFIFPDLDKEIFDKGYYAIIEIELSNGKKLIAYSKNSYRFKE